MAAGRSLHEQGSDTSTPEGSRADAAARPSPTALRWGPPVLFALLLASIARRTGEGISDPDALWHVVAGRQLWLTHELVGTDPLASFTTQPWILNQWLPELAMAGADHVGGLRALAWLATAGRLGVCLSLLLLCRRMASPLAATVVASAAILGTADSLSPRPQLLGFMLMALVVSAWLSTAKDLRVRWWLIPATWLWACCHGTWVAGLSVGAATVLGLLLDRRLTWRSATRLVGVLVGSAVSTAVTPVGPRLYESFLTVRAVSPYVSEWQTLTLFSPSVLVVALLALLPATLWLLRRDRATWTMGLLWLVGVVWAASSMRTVALGAILLAPLAAKALDQVLGATRQPLGREGRIVVAASMALALTVAGVASIQSPRGPQLVPMRLDESLDALMPGTVVWNSDTLGGWLMYAHGGLRHTADTRAEIYGPSRAAAYLRIINTSTGWERDFDSFGARAALIGDAGPLVNALRQRGWHVIGRDGGYTLLEDSTGMTASAPR